MMQPGRCPCSHTPCPYLPCAPPPGTAAMTTPTGMQWGGTLDGRAPGKSIACSQRSSTKLQDKSAGSNHMTIARHPKPSCPSCPRPCIVPATTATFWTKLLHLLRCSLREAAQNTCKSANHGAAPNNRQAQTEQCTTNTALMPHHAQPDSGRLLKQASASSTQLPGLLTAQHPWRCGTQHR
jgi:hypothetical protein